MDRRLQEIYDEAGGPGAQAFRFAVRRAGLQISENDARAFTAKQSTRQVFQRRIQSDGRILGGGREDTRWQMDLIDFSKKIQKLNQGHKYVLVAVDNYNRQVFTQPMPRKTAEATLEAFRKIIKQNDGVMPKEITVDLGNEYALIGKEINDKGGVLRRKNMQAINELSIADRAIGKLKTILSGYSLTNWADSLKRATTAYNNKSHSYLMGSAPDDVKGSAELQYELDRVHGEQIKHNNDKWRKKAAKLRDAGAFRIPRPRDTWERIDAPKFSGETYNVDGFKGSHVESGDRTFPVKTTLAVPAGSADVDLGDAGPGQGRRAQQREVLQDYAKDLQRLIPSDGLTLVAARGILQGMRGAVDTMDLYGPARTGRYVSFLKLFPNLFKIQGSGANIKVFKADPIPSTPPRPVQEGAASSSTDRAPRAIEVDPRAPYRRFPNDTRVEYSSENPARVDTPRNRRYRTYSVANTIGMARRLGASSQDISLDLQAGALRLL